MEYQINVISIAYQISYVIIPLRTKVKNIASIYYEVFQRPH